MKENYWVLSGLGTVVESPLARFPNDVATIDDVCEMDNDPIITL
jgi:hypothetical protein